MISDVSSIQINNSKKSALVDLKVSNISISQPSRRKRWNKRENESPPQIVMHTCYLRVKEQQGMDFKKPLGKYDAKVDANFYRKISKYDIDSLNVDWQGLFRERQRQITYNNSQNLQVVGVEAQDIKIDEAKQKIMKIIQVKKDKDAKLAESKHIAMKN